MDSGERCRLTPDGAAVSSDSGHLTEKPRSSRPPQPDAAALVPKTERQGLLEETPVEALEERVEQHDLQSFVESEECSERVGLAPDPTLGDPGSRISNGWKMSYRNSGRFSTEDGR